METAVLMHGAWHSPWYRHEVVSRLPMHAVPVDGLLTFRADRALEVLFHDCPEPEEAARHLLQLASGHTQLLSQPDLVAEIITRSANSAS